MSSIYRRGMMRNARPSLDLNSWPRQPTTACGIGSAAGLFWYSELQSDRRFKIALYAERVPGGSTRRQLSGHDMASRRHVKAMEENRDASPAV